MGEGRIQFKNKSLQTTGWRHYVGSHPQKWESVDRELEGDLPQREQGRNGVPSSSWQVAWGVKWHWPGENAGPPCWAAHNTGHQGGLPVGSIPDLGRHTTSSFTLGSKSTPRALSRNICSPFQLLENSKRIQTKWHYPILPRVRLQCGVVLRFRCFPT